MGLRLGETLALQVGDIDARRKQVHVWRSKTIGTRCDILDT